MANTTTEIVTVDGTVLNTYATNIMTGTGRIMTPEIRGEDILVPGRSGALYVPNKVVGPGEFVWAMWVQGCNSDGTIPGGSSRRLQFETNLASLLRLFTRRSRLSYVTAVQADGTTREANVQWVETIEASTMMGRGRAEFTVAGMLPDVWWQTTANDGPQAATVGATLPKTLNLSNFTGMTGTIEDATLTIAGPIQTPRVTDTDSGVWVQLNTTLGSGESWVLNASNWTSTVGGVDKTSITTHGGHGRYIIISPMNSTSTTPQLVLSGTGGGTNTNLTVTTARRKWLTA